MVNEIRARWAEGQRRVLGVLPTGGGKTEVAIEIMDEMPRTRGRALVVIERKSLCAQWVAPAAPPRRAAPHRRAARREHARVDAPILVATAQTIRARGVPEDVALVVIDESHIWHKAHDDVLAATGEANVLGLTATPLREGLGLRFDVVVIGATIRATHRAGPSRARPLLRAEGRGDRGGAGRRWPSGPGTSMPANSRASCERA